MDVDREENTHNVKNSKNDANMSASDKSSNFKYQKELAYNKLLPYSNVFEEESKTLLAVIKANLGRAVMLREIEPGCIVWTNRLCQYIKLYGMRFSKDDHILFIKLMYELVTIPQLDPFLVNRFGAALIILLKKKGLISPEDLELPWKPFYDLMRHVKKIGPLYLRMYSFTPGLTDTLHSVVYAIKNYFPLSATQEILDELRPTLCPLRSHTMNTSMEALRLFLPVHLSPKYHSFGHQLWLKEFMMLWEVCHNAQKWESDLMWLIAELANFNIGYIDWEPYIPLMFARFLRCLQLPVSYDKFQVCKYHKLDSGAIAIWITAVLGNGSSAQMYLDKFLRTIETYIHPANTGRWLIKLRELLTKLPHFFTLRLHRERYRKPTWENSIPEEYKLKDSDIDAFVKSMLPLAMTAVFSKLGINDASQALQSLATMRPSLVIPVVLEKNSSILDRLSTEPHKLTATLNCLVAIARPMAQGSRNINKGYTYPEGPTQILPLLFLLLPNIDPNDTHKCFAVFRLIAAYAAYLPTADSSKPPEMMDEEERMIYETTSGLEDFVLQFLDRIFFLIESSSLESVRLESRGGSKKSTLERITESVLREVCMFLLLQINDKIFECALHKLRTFVTERILETNVAGQLAAVLCGTFTRVNGQKTLHTLMPVLSKTILDITGESNDIIKEENLDHHLLHAMLLLSAIVNTTGNHLLPYINTLTDVLDRVLVLKSREGNNLACRLLKIILQSLTNTVPYQIGTRNKVKHWGQALDINTLTIKWYIPGEEEMSAAKQIFFKYLLPEINKLQQYCKDWNTLTRDELLTSLNILNCIIEPCEPVLAVWKEEPLIGVKSSLEWVEMTPTLGTKEEISMPDNGNVRRHIATLMRDVQKVILQNVEDDTKSLFVLVQIWNSLLLGRMRLMDTYNSKRKNFQGAYKKIKDELVRNKELIAPLVLKRAEIQHETRILSQTFNLTETHRQIMLELLTLATSRYADVRSQAQSSLQCALQIFQYAYPFVVPHLVDILKKDTEKYHDAYKGVLYILLGPHEEPIIVKRDVTMLRTLWPAIVLSKTSEKLSVICLRETLLNLINKHLPMIAIKNEIPERCLKIVENFWKTCPEPNLPQPVKEEIKKGLQTLQEIGESNLTSYNGLVDDLLSAILEKNLHWRHRLMAMNLIHCLVHPDQIYPPKVVRYFLRALIHDSLYERKIALRMVSSYILKHQKRKHPKITIEPPTLSENSESEKNQKLIPGQRSDNVWLQYNYETRPLTAEQWDEPRFIHKAYNGYYTWPKKLEVYAPSSEQPSLDPDTRELTDQEKEVYVFFNDPQNITKLVKYFSLEEKKGKDKFDCYKFLLFKRIFCNHGIVLLKHFLPHLHKLVTDKQENSQKCAAEIISGLIRGTKHWPFHMVSEMWDSLLPIIRLALTNLTAESIANWVTCFGMAQQHRDPNRQHWLLECLMEEPRLGESESSFVECGRLFTLQAALDEQSWRVSELLHRVLKRTEDRLLTNPFEIVRKRLGSVLVTVFHADFRSPYVSNDQPTPRMQDFLDKIVPTLQSLVAENTTVFSKEEKSSSEQVANVTFDDSVNESTSKVEHRKMASRLLETVCKWITNTMLCSQHGVRPEFYQIFPIVCQLENCDTDEELTKLCTSTIAVFAQALTLPQDMPAALEAVTKMSNNSSWWKRSTCLMFLQVFVFYNMSIIVSNPTWITCVKDIVLKLLEDERVEVRKEAGRILSGLLHCTFIPDAENLLEEFKRKAKKKLYKEHSNHTKEKTERSLTADAIRIRHAAVLGMCAFIQAHPYDVPEYVPPIFEHLGPHMNDPQPIPTTIRKTLDDFRRTHYDAWRCINGYAEYFTQEQLATLQDLTMPPSHYA